VLSHVAGRVLDELTLARMTLDGELPAEKLPVITEATDEGERHRLTVLALIDRLRHLLIDVANVAEDADRAIYGMVEGVELSSPSPLKEERKVFGFAAARNGA
jgi:hypothetical protein